MKHIESALAAAAAVAVGVLMPELEEAIDDEIRRLFDEAHSSCS